MTKDRQHLIYSIVPAIAFGLLMLLIYGLGLILPPDLSVIGLRPRTLQGLIGIFTAPMLHGSWEHLLSNLPPVIILSAAILYVYRPIGGRVLIWSYLLPGIWVWAMARPSIHIGASGWVYAMASFLFFSGVFRREIRALALGLIVAFLYGGMVWGVLPQEEGISWESHLFGGLGGILIAFYYRKSGGGSKRKDYKETTLGPEHELWDYKNIFPPPEGFQYPDKDEN